MRELTTKQKRFVEEYLIDGNASDAARRAGYSPVSASQIGRGMLTKSAVKLAIEEGLKKKDSVIRSQQTGLIADWSWKRSTTARAPAMQPG